MKGFYLDMEKAVSDNSNFRKVLYTSTHLQLVLMSLQPGEDIGGETHADTDQFFRIEQGQGKCIINENEYDIKAGDVVVVPAGARHNVVNTSPATALKLYTIYTPPHHKDGVVRATKEQAAAEAAAFDGKTSEYLNEPAIRQEWTLTTAEGEHREIY